MKLLTFLTGLFSLLLWHSFDANGQQYGKYTLYSIQNTSATQLIDTNGTVFKSWTHATTARTGYSSYLMPGGVLWRTVQNQGNQLMGGGLTGKIQKVAWDGTVLWDYTYSSSTYCLHHDICPLPNGNVLAISYDVKTAAQATQAGASQSIIVWSEKIIEIQPTGATTGQIVWEWKAWDHLMQNANPSKDNYVTSLIEHPEKLNINYLLKKDWIHMNGLDYNPKTNQIAFSSHYLNEWYVIDHSTTSAQAATGLGGNSGKGGDILYRFGNPAAYGGTGTQILKVTHDVHWIPDDVPNMGRLVGFNNQGVSTSQSCVDQIMPPANGLSFDHTAGQPFQPLTYLQRTVCSGYSSNMGSSQQLPNGNMLICVATAGRMYEIDPQGNTLWTKTATGTVAQAFRYSECYVNTTAPAIPVITTAGNLLQSTTASGYQWFRDGIAIENANAQTYFATQPGFYVVRVKGDVDCAGLYSYSEGMMFTPSSNLSVNLTASSTSICYGDSAVIQSQVSPAGGNVSYFWYSEPAGFTDTASSVRVYPSVSTSFFVVASNGTETDTAEISITVRPLPTTPDLIFENDSLKTGPADAYFWYRNDTLVSTGSQAWFVPTVSGTYTVRIEAPNQCRSEPSYPVNVTVTGIRSVLRPTDFQLVPNPSSGSFKIESASEAPFASAVLITPAGKQIRQIFQPVVSEEGLPAGVYYIRITNANHQISVLPVYIQP